MGAHAETLDWCPEPGLNRHAPFQEAADFKPEHGIRTGLTMGLDEACCSRFSAKPRTSIISRCAMQTARFPSAWLLAGPWNQGLSGAPHGKDQTHQVRR